MVRARRFAIPLAALALAGCASAAAVPTTRDAASDVAFTGCDQVACEGTLDGAAYQIVMPEKWNGTLLLYSHGYRPAQPFPPNFAPVESTPVPVPGWREGDTELGDALLQRGYALAGSAYASNGWAVEDGIRAGEQVHDFFVQNVGSPKRVYVWGDSLGGLITQSIAEKHPEWVSGAAPLCGVVAGLPPNIDLALDVTYGVQQLLDPGIEVAGYTSYEQAVTTWQDAASILIDGAREQDLDVIGKVLTLAAVVDAPSRTRSFDGHDIVSTVSGTIESLLTALGYGTVGRFEIEQRFGGNVSGNVGTDYAARISDEERALIDAVAGKGAADRYAAQLDAGPRIAADPQAAAAARERGGNPSGAVQVPTITMHTADDPLVIAQNETVLRDRYQRMVAAGKVRGGLVQLYTVPPAEYPKDPGAPYGAGHCNFTTTSRLAVIDLLDGWVKNGVYPGQGAIAAAMGPDSGYNAIWSPGPWPASLPVEGPASGG